MLFDSKLLTLYHLNTSAFISNKWGQASTNHNAATITGKSAWTHFYQRLLRPYPRFCTGLESCTAFNSHISLVTFSLEEFLIFSLTSMKLGILKITDQFFHRMSLKWIIWWSDSGYASLAGMPQMCYCPLLTVSFQLTCSFEMFCYGWCSQWSFD